MTEHTPASGGFGVGSRVASYRLDEEIGRGGMAVVYRAYDIRLERPVALKVLAPQLAQDEGFRQRFIRESRTAAAVDHPNIIPIFEAGEAGGVLFIAMRFVQGSDVQTLVDQEGPFTVARACHVITQVAGALEAAHSHGLVHRDVKPGNILLDITAGPDLPGHAYLSDFGLSKRALASSALTSTGQFLGTVDYIAPEQIEARAVDGRTDEYALACAAYTMLSGQPPFVRDQSIAVMWAQVSAPPPPLTSRRPDLPAAVDEVLAKALAKVAAERYATCPQFAAALRQACGPQSGPGRVPATPALPREQAPLAAAEEPGAAGEPAGPAGWILPGEPAAGVPGPGEPAAGVPGPGEASPEETGPPEASPEETGPPEASPEETGPPEASPEEPGPPDASPGQAGRGRPGPGEASPTAPAAPAESGPGPGRPGGPPTEEVALDTGGLAYLSPPAAPGPSGPGSSGAGPPGADPPGADPPGADPPGAGSPGGGRPGGDRPRPAPGAARSRRQSRAAIAVGCVAVLAAVGWLLFARNGGTGHQATPPAPRPAAFQLPTCTTAVATAPRLSRVTSQHTSVGGSPFDVATQPGFAFVTRIDGQLDVLNTSTSPPSRRWSVQVPHGAQGEAITPDQRDLVVSSGSGINVFQVAALEQGPASPLGFLSSPGQQHAVEVAVTPDGRFAFVTYQNTERVGVFNLQRAVSSGFGPGDLVGLIPVGSTPIGIAISPDGRYAYVTSSNGSISGNGPGNGTLSVIDVPTAETHPASSVIKTVAAGCHPARVITSADGQQVWVTATGSNALLGFSAARLLGDPQRALVARQAVGATPLGLVLVDHGTRIVVADAARSGKSSVPDLAVVSVQAALDNRSAILGFVPSGKQPRQFALVPGGGTLLVTDTNAQSLQAVSLAHLP